MCATLALAGDTMLGRGVAERLKADPAAPLFAPEIADCIAGADAFVLNLECCISERGSRFPEPGKPFFFRAPPVAAVRLAELGVDAVALANNHALDYGADALLDTLAYIEAAGIVAVGAGVDEETARADRLVRCGELELRLLSFSDHPAGYAAGPEHAGIAFADLRAGLPTWVKEAMADGNGDALVVTPHWGPNMVAEPLDYVRRAADGLVAAGAMLVAGHSAHVFQAVAAEVLFDLGDFLDDYAVDRELRNDLGLLWLVELERGGGVGHVRAVPLALDYCFTRIASPAEADWIVRRLQALCAPFGTEVDCQDGMIELRPESA